MASDSDTHQFGSIILSGKDAHREESIGALRMHKQGFGWKSRKTGKVIAISKGELRQIEWIKVPHAFMIKMRVKGGITYRFSGLKAQDRETVKEYCRTNFDIEVQEVNLSWRGWNWGETSVEGMNISFRVEDEQAFEIPINDITQATSVKNEATIEMADDDTAMPEDEMMMEIRFFVPNAVVDDEEPDPESLTGAESLVSAIQESGGMQGTDTGNALVSFDDVPIQVPRGRYEVELFDKYMKLHGKTYDYKVLYTNISGIFVLPKPDGYHMALCLSLEHPLRQGATMYPHMIFQLPIEQQVELELKMSEEEAKRRFDGKLEVDERGNISDVMAKVLSAFTKKKVTTPKSGGFNSDKEDKLKSIRCSMKANEGQLYPLDKCFFFVASKPVMLEFDRIGSIEFNRVDKSSSASAARTFDITVSMKDGSGSSQFVNLQRSDYNELFRFLTSKKIRIKNINTASQVDFDDEDEDGEVDDVYMDRVRRNRTQAAAEEDDDDDDESEGEDEDFKPGEESDVDEEYEEGPVKDGEGAGAKKRKNDSDESSDDGDDDDEEDKPKPKAKAKAAAEPKEKKQSKAKEVKEGGKKKRAKKDKDAPKRGSSAYLLFMNANRARIKESNPDASVTDVVKMGAAEWKELDAEARAPWEEKAAADKLRYDREMKEYKTQTAAAKQADDSSDDKEEDEPPAKSKAKESDDDDDDDDE